MSTIGKPHPDAIAFRCDRRVGRKQSKDGRLIGDFRPVRRQAEGGGVAEHEWPISEFGEDWLVGLEDGVYRFSWRGEGGKALSNGPEFEWGAKQPPEPPEPTAEPSPLELADYVDRQVRARVARELSDRELQFQRERDWREDVRKSDEERARRDREEREEWYARRQKEEDARHKRELEETRERHKQDMERLTTLMQQSADQRRGDEVAELRQQVQDLIDMLDSDDEPEPTPPPAEPRPSVTGNPLGDAVIDVVGPLARDIGGAAVQRMRRWASGPGETDPDGDGSAEAATAGGVRGSRPDPPRSR